jgi:lysine N6-hydroxylase
MNIDPQYDLVGIGVGPFNLSLAALLAPEQIERRAATPAPRSLFLEARENFDWHPGMILPGTTLQVPFLADLVTMVDPTSPFSFLNYLHENGRLYNFYFYENFKIFRKEYNLYCRWVSERLDNLRNRARVVDVRHLSEDGGFRVFYQDGPHGATRSVESANLVLGYGTRPRVPDCAEPHLGPLVCHTADYRRQRAHIQSARRIVVIGSGQSAGECVLDLLQGQLTGGYEIHWYSRGAGFLPMEYSKLGLEHFSPDYIDYFHRLDEETRDRIRAGQDLFYKGISSVTIGAIYDAIYENRLERDAPAVQLMAGTELRDMRPASAGSHGFELELLHRTEGGLIHQTADAVILGTGYHYELPDFLSSILPDLITDASGRLQITRDYRARRRDSGTGDIFVQNGEIHSHGIGAPDLGLGAYRAASIVNTLTQTETYRLNPRNVFQSFSTKQQATSEPIAADARQAGQR